MQKNTSNYNGFSELYCWQPVVENVKIIQVTLFDKLKLWGNIALFYSGQNHIKMHAETCSVLKVVIALLSAVCSLHVCCKTLVELDQ